MFSYLVRRILYAVPILLGVILITFVLDNVMTSPDEKASRVLGPKVMGKARVEWIHNRGLDLPYPTQFARHLGNLARLQFGTSWQTQRDLRDVFRDGALPSLLITVPGFFAAFAASVSLALFQVFVRDSPLDRGLTLFSVALMSIPTMVYVIFGQAILAIGLSYFPAFGFSYSGIDTMRFLLLPVTIFILINVGYDARLYRAIFLEEINQDYVRTAHAKGLSNTRVLTVHVFKNGLISIITLVVAQVPKLVLGSLLIESLFGIPGLGSVLVQAIQTGDQPVIMASVFIGSVLYITGLIATDICYALADPRIRLGETKETSSGKRVPWGAIVVVGVCLFAIGRALVMGWRFVTTFHEGSLISFLTDLFAKVWFQNAVVIAAFALVFFLLRAGARNERWQRAWQRLKRDRTGMIAFVVIFIYLGLGALELLRTPDATAGSRSILDRLTFHIRNERTYSAPLADELFGSVRTERLEGRHLLGTDVLGKDVFVQTLKACRTALVIGGLTTAIYVPLGTLLGILAGYYRRWVDDLIQYIYSTLASIPEILLLVAILITLGKGLGTMSIALGVTGWVGLCRLIRGETMRQSERPYVAAARAIGQTHRNIVMHHLLPNVMHLVLISAVLGFSNIVLAEAILSYLGVGAPVGTASWGAMIDSGRTELSRDPLVWWNITAATTALFGLVLALNLLGDSLRRAFDPKRG